MSRRVVRGVTKKSVISQISSANVCTDNPYFFDGVDFVTAFRLGRIMRTYTLNGFGTIIKPYPICMVHDKIAHLYRLRVYDISYQSQNFRIGQLTLDPETCTIKLGMFLDFYTKQNEFYLGPMFYIYPTEFLEVTRKPLNTVLIHFREVHYLNTLPTSIRRLLLYKDKPLPDFSL